MSLLNIGNSSLFMTFSHLLVSERFPIHYASFQPGCQHVYTTFLITLYPLKHRKHTVQNAPFQLTSAYLLGLIDMIDFSDSDSGFGGYFDIMNATMGTAIQTSVEAQNVKPTDAVIKYSVIDWSDRRTAKVNIEEYKKQPCFSVL